jgi:hemerythrin superfamily protein
VGKDIVAYLECKFYEDREEALARGMPLVEDGEEVSEQQFFDTELYSITEFKDFDENEWREAHHLIDCYEEEIIKHQRVEKKKAEHDNKRKHHSIN